MRISTSILSIKDNIEKNIEKLNNTTTDFIHLDIMDGLFVPSSNDVDFNLQFNKPLDIHLMVNDVLMYFNKYKKLKPMYLTFHVEATNNVDEVISMIKKENIKVGISIKPDTSVNSIIEYLPFIDLVLIMSVEPGYGGQKFIDESVNKISELVALRDKNNYTYLIEIDGGINREVINKIKDVDIIVVGSYITNSNNYQKKIDELL